MSKLIRSDPNRVRALIVIILLIGFAWRLPVAMHVYATYRPGTPAAGDAALYLALAANLSAGHGYTLDGEPPHRPFVMRPPVYPMFLAAVLALTGGSHAAAIIVQIILDLATGVLLHRLAARLWPERRRLPLIALALWATCPAVGSMAGRFLAEVLAAFLATLALVLMAEARGRGSWRVAFGFASGAALMCAVLSRPQLAGAIVGLPILAHAVARGEAAKGAVAGLAAAALIGVVVADAPWAIRNLAVSGRLIPLSSGYASRALAMGIDENLGETRGEVDERLADAGVDAAGDRPDDGRVDPYLDYALARIRAHPLRYLGASLARALLLWVSPRTSVYGVPSRAIIAAARDPGSPGALGRLALVAALGVYYLGLLALALAGAIRAWRDPMVRALVFVVPVALTLVTMWFHLEARYALPAFPVLVLAAALAIDSHLAPGAGGRKGLEGTAPAC